MIPASPNKRHRMLIAGGLNPWRADSRPGVQGGDCFGTFMQSGLPKHILKDIWAVVAGDVGRLTMPQFLSCMYLLDLAKRGKVISCYLFNFPDDILWVVSLGGNRGANGVGLRI